MEQIYVVCKLAKECLNVKGEDRPNLKEVAMELQGLILGGKHSWERNNADSIEEMEYLLPNDHDGMGGVSSDMIASAGIILVCQLMEEDDILL